jgi:two-component system chemotaxis response regulator CheB
MNQDRIRIIFVSKNSATEGPSVQGIVQATQDMEIVGTAKEMKTGLDLVRTLSPDIVLLEDRQDLVEFTVQARKISSHAGIILISESKEPTGAKRIVDALAVGAFDVVPGLETSHTVSNLLLSKIRCCSIKQYSRLAQISRPKANIAPAPVPRLKGESKFDAILIGVSTGGPEALVTLLSGLHPSTRIPIVIVLHMPKEFTGAMAAALDRKCPIRVSEAQDGEPLQPGRVYLAPGGRHCTLERSPENLPRLVLNDAPPDNGCRPSVNVLFRSACPVLGSRTLAIVLTGMGSDGTNGAIEIKKSGGAVMVQDEQSSVVWGMPGSVVRAGIADEIVPLGDIANRIYELVGGG